MSAPTGKNRLIMALDVPTEDDALRLVDRLAGEVRFFKIGLELAAAGADGFSLTVHASEQPRRPEFVRSRAVFGSAEDAELAVAIATGRELGLRPVLVVEPQLAPWSTWFQSADIAHADRVEDFFRLLGRLSLHYALLAELTGVEVLALGGQLENLARTLPGEADTDFRRGVRSRAEASWRALFARLRGPYGGALTYVAGQGSEAKQVGFWDALDVVGLRARSVFPERDSERDPEAPPKEGRVARVLRGTIGEAASFGVSQDRPVLFVELGFPARTRAWDDWTVPDGEPDSSGQERYLETLDEVLRGRPAREAPVGVLLWSIGTTDDPARNAGYAPLGEEARALFDRILDRG